MVFGAIANIFGGGGGFFGKALQIGLGFATGGPIGAAMAAAKTFLPPSVTNILNPGSTAEASLHNRADSASSFGVGNDSPLFNMASSLVGAGSPGSNSVIDALMQIEYV
jgi:hypothetical protein